MLILTLILNCAKGAPTILSFVFGYFGGPNNCIGVGRTVHALLVLPFAQLYLDFSVTTKSIAPVNMAPGKARSWKGVSDFRLQDVSKEADAKGPQTLAAQSKIFILCLKWLHAQGVYPFGHDREKIDRTDELNWIGIRGWFPALKGRPKLASGFDSALALDAYLKQASPPSRHFNLHWRVSGLPVPQHPESLNLSFDQIVRCILDQQH